ncbi:hypothetical protein AgCh_026900 [Apium graveolens]
MFRINFYSLYQMGEAENPVSRGASCGGYRTSGSSREEEGENVAVVMISAEGSWKAATESNDQRDHATESNDQRDHKTSINVPEVLSQQELCTENDAPDLMFLSDGDDEMDMKGICPKFNHVLGFRNYFLCNLF